MTSNTITNNLVAIHGGNNNNTDNTNNILGNLLWFTVSDLEILREDLIKLMQHSGVPEKYIPAPIRPTDAFRRATSEVSGVINSVGDETTVLMVREVLSDEERIVRHVILERRDKKQIRLSYDQIGSIEFDRRTETIIASASEDSSRAAAVKSKMLFDRYRDYYSADHIRRMLKTVLDDCQAVGVRPSGGIYFVPRLYESTVKALSSLIKTLPGNTVELHLVPLIDAAEQRDMIEEKLRSHVLGQVSQIGSMLGGNADVLGVKKTLKSLASEFAAVLREQPCVSKVTASNAINQLQGLKAQIVEYEGLLESNLGEVRSTLDVLRRQVRTMLDRQSVEGVA